MKNIVFLLLSISAISATRGHESWVNVYLHLPDFTIVSLLIAGVYFRRTFIAIALIVVAVAIDNYAITYQGVGAHCITPAYSFLLLSYYMIFWASKFLTSFIIDNNIIKNMLVVTLIISVQWFLATLSYYVFTPLSWAKFPAYILNWSVVEIPPTLYIAVAMMITLTFAKRFIFTLSGAVVKY